MRKVICSIVCALLLVSCGEYNKILKSTDYELKYDYAKKAFERKKYMQAATLLEELVAIFKGTDRAEESLYLLARSYYLNKDYITSGSQVFGVDVGFQFFHTPFFHIKKQPSFCLTVLNNILL